MLSSRKTSAPVSGGILLTKSLRFRSSASAYLNRTFASTPTSWTASFWVKRGQLGSVQIIFGSRLSGTGSALVGFLSNDTLIVSNNSTSVATNAIYRDTSAWYHFTVNWTSGNSVSIYCNGVLQSVTGSISGANQLFTSSWTNTIGRDGDSSSYYFDGYLADVYFIDGQSLTPSSFGVTNGTTGQWSPATYSGTYGTNGFHLTFANTTSTTTLGYDTSGNSNNWTTNNISLTAGSTYDSMNDVPTLTSATASNYSVINPLLGNATTPTNGNLTWNRSTLASYESILSTFGVKSGKWYIEFVPSSFDAAGIGITTLPTIFTTYPGGTSNLWWIYDNGASNIIWNQTSANVATTRYASGQTWQIALDMDTGVCWVGISNTFYNSTNTGTGNPSTGSNPTFSSLPTSSPMFIFIQSYDTNWSVNFGQQPFTYTPPSGFVALNTYNIPTGTVTTTGTFTGNSSANGPFVYLNGIPTAMTINANSVTFGTNANKLANGFQVTTSSSSYNLSGTNTYIVTSTGNVFKTADAQTNP
jgi:hypothetical protein